MMRNRRIFLISSIRIMRGLVVVVVVVVSLHWW